MVSHTSGVAVVLDFDGTMTVDDVGDLVADRFGDPGWRALDEAHHRGALEYRDLIANMFESMRVDESALAAYAREVATLRPGTRAFLRAAQRLGLSVTIASGGLDVYIRAILGTALDAVTLVANEARFDGDRLRLYFPAGTRPAGDCGRCGNCKAVVVESLRARGAREVIAVGDGVSDRCLARTADVVVARGWLYDHARSLGRAPIAFEDFHDVARAVAERVPGFAEAFTRAWD